MKRFKNMSEVHNECENERYKISHKIYKPTIKEIIDPEYLGQEEGDIITTLYDREEYEVVMSDSEMEKRTNLDFINKATGDVLIGGLGLGMIILAIQDKEDIKSITVVEISQELVDLVMVGLKDKLNDKVKIIIDDIKQFKTDSMYDTIYFDIWNNVSGDNFGEMRVLKNKFQKNSLNNIMQWRFIDTAYYCDDEEKYNALSEDEAIQVVLKGLSKNSEDEKDLFCETNFNQKRMNEAIEKKNEDIK